MAKFVDVFSKATGRPHRVPEHFVDDPVLGRDIRKTPPSEADQKSAQKRRATETPGTGEKE